MTRTSVRSSSQREIGSFFFATAKTLPAYAVSAKHFPIGGLICGMSEPTRGIGGAADLLVFVAALAILAEGVVDEMRGYH